MARQTHVDGVAGVVEGIGALVYEDDVGIGLKDGFDYAQSGPVVHGHYVLGIGQTVGELDGFDLCLGLQRGYPLRVGFHGLAFEAGEDGVERQAHVAYDRSGGGHVDVHLLGLDVKVYELDIGIPFAVAERQQPVEACANHYHDIGLLHDGLAARQGAEGADVGHQALCH